MKHGAIVFGSLYGSYVIGVIVEKLPPRYGFMLSMVFGAIAMAAAMAVGASE